ncbi:MAG: type II toxin-antitoxin system HicB family antitoxin [Devosia sp.]|nr:type II toxin-antitoxin system HicB family antitoxin [Devosia sp.]
MRYAVDLIPDEEVILVECPDIPGVHTFGDDEEEALRHARDAIESMIEMMIADRQPVPLPRARRKHYVDLPAIIEAKISLHGLMLAQKLRKADLVRLLGWRPTQVDRLLDLRHASRLDQLEQAFRVLGKRLEIGVKDAA